MQAAWGRNAVVFLLAAALAAAHHSTGSYDLIHGTIIEGVVTRFRWENPHAQLLLDVRGDRDAIEHWTIELESPSTLQRNGWTRTVLKPEDHITVVGGRAKDGSFRLRASYIQWPDGRKLAALDSN